MVSDGRGAKLNAAKMKLILMLQVATRATPTPSTPSLSHISLTCDNLRASHHHLHHSFFIWLFTYCLRPPVYCVGVANTWEFNGQAKVCVCVLVLFVRVPILFISLACSFVRGAAAPLAVVSSLQTVQRHHFEEANAHFSHELMTKGESQVG